jgi:hypothetical protein
MRVPRAFVVLSIFALSLVASAAQQTPSTSSPQAIQLLQRALLALSSGTLPADITLTGTVRRIAGSDDETGSATLKALVGIGSRIDFSLPSGTWTEVRNNSTNGPAGSWSGPGRVAHRISHHNLLTDTGLFPVLTLSSFTSSSAVVTYIGSDVRNGVSVTHISAYQLIPALKGDPLFQHLSQVDIFLDASTLLPASIAFSLHPDDNALLDIPLEIRFSDYRPVGGAQVPFRIQKYLNNSLILDLQLQSTAFNTGLTAADFSVQ